MSGQQGKAFDLQYGLKSNDMWRVYLLVVVGILTHWIWELAVRAIDTGAWDFGSRGIIIARVAVALIAGVVSFAGVWKQLEKVDPKLRFVAAITQGFAIDALTAPVADAANT